MKTSERKNYRKPEVSVVEVEYQPLLGESSLDGDNGQNDGPARSASSSFFEDDSAPQ